VSARPWRALRPTIVVTLAAALLAVGCATTTTAVSPQHPIEDPLEDQTAQQLFGAGVRIAQQGDYIRAEQYFTAARDHGYPEAEVLPLLMQVCVHSSRYSAAVGYAEPYLETHPDDWRLRQLLATIQMGLGNSDAARLSLEHVVAEAPDEPVPHYMLGVLLRDELHDEPGMRTQFERYLALAPEGTHATEAREALGLLVAPTGPIPVRLHPEDVPPAPTTTETPP
jgi:Flp pilus assembly protein TadD